MTIKQIYNKLYEMLAPVVGKGEARDMAYMIIEEIKSYKQLDVVLYGDRELLPETEQRMLAIADRIIGGEPIQYILGSASFLGRTFAVSPAVLVPRPETGQLVDLIVKDWRGHDDIDILDIGTGSGCIAISLALDLWPCNVDAIDISPDALAIAQKNAETLKAKVRFSQGDALDMPHDREKYDVIVSNPPYVMEKEKKKMDARVLDHEPSQALFVPDKDALRFYTPIANYAKEALKAGGKLYFEINPKKADEMQQMLLSIGFDTVDIICDYRQRKRFAVASG